MRALLDACVLYPTTLRGMLMAAASKGLFVPVWSERILEEWARASGRNFGPEGEEVARVESSLLSANWPDARVELTDPPSNLPHLPDENDQHVLQAALQASADTLITHNLRDFPTRLLSPLGIAPRNPDSVFCEWFVEDRDAISEIAYNAYSEIKDFPEAPKTLRALLKKAGLPRLGKVLSNLPH